MTRFTVLESSLVVPPYLLGKLALVLEEGRRELASYIAENVDVAQWFAEFDGLAPIQATPPAPPRTVISAAQAAEVLGLTPRRVGQMAEKLGGWQVGNRWCFDLGEVEDERDARRD